MIPKYQREHNYKAIKSWMMEFDLHSLCQKLDPVDPLAVISKMTAIEQQVVLSLIAASNRLGHDQQRKWRREHKINNNSLSDQKSQSIARDNRLTFKVIQGGAA